MSRAARASYLKDMAPPPDQGRKADEAPPGVLPMSPAEAIRRQAAYVASRRAWAECVGRPYEGESDPRPPPGELDAAADE